MEPNRTKKANSDIFEGLTLEQWRFITARLGTATDKAAAAEIGVNDKTPSKWKNKAQVDKAVELLQRRAADGAVDAISQATLRAAMTIVKLLDSDDEAIRLRAAQDLMDRATGKPTQRTEVTGADGEPLFKVVDKLDYDSV
jgi:transposase-like protein